MLATTAASWAELLRTNSHPDAIASARVRALCKPAPGALALGTRLGKTRQARVAEGCRKLGHHAVARLPFEHGNVPPRAAPQARTTGSQTDGDGTPRVAVRARGHGAPGAGRAGAAARRGARAHRG